MECNESGYLEALEADTASLEKRVDDCRSRLMVVTVFDIAM